MNVASLLGYHAARRVGSSSGLQDLSDEHDQAEEPQHTRDGPAHGSGAPLPLGLQAEMSPHLLEGRLDVPAVDVPGHDVLSCSGGVGAEQCQRWSAPGRVPHQHPAQRKGSGPVGMPQRRPGRDFDRCRTLAVPDALTRPPHRRCIGELLTELGLTRPFARFGAGRAGWPRRHWVVQLSIEHEPGDQSHPADPTGMAELHNSERAVADYHDLALRLPASHQTEQHTSAYSGVVRWRRPSLALVAGASVGYSGTGAPTAGGSTGPAPVPPSKASGCPHS